MLGLKFLPVWIAVFLFSSVDIAWTDDSTVNPKAANPKAEKPAEGSVQLWIGVMCHPVNEALTAQLALPNATGLVVGSVVDGGPADEAGIQQFDILLRAGDAALSNTKDLSSRVQQAGQQPVAIELMRAGQRQNVKVTPVPAPDEQPQVIVVPDSDRRALREWAERMAGSDETPPTRRFRLRFLHPGKLLGDGDIADSFPNDVSISFDREGNNPLKITVEKDGEKWEVDKAEMSQLPEQMLPLVKRMLGDRIPGLAGTSDLEVDLPEIDAQLLNIPQVNIPQVNNPQTPSPTAVEGEPAPPTLDEKMQQLQQRLIELEQQLQSLQDKDSKKTGQ
ncbi:MAG: PDZ domain-containing protein [Planctomycetales bacterium]